MRTQNFRKISWVSATATAAVWLVLALAAPSVSAEIAASPCPGNICGGSLTVGGKTVNYQYTQHVRPDGTFKIRFNGGTYDTNRMISFMVFDLPPFTAWGKYANPDGSIFLPTEDVNPGRTAYERRATSGCSGCRVDQVMSVKFAGLSSGQHTFNLYLLQNNASGGKNGLVFYVHDDPAQPAPSNQDESDVWNAINGLDFPCADGVDNDLSYQKDCADLNCDGQIGEVGTDHICDNPEGKRDATNFTCSDEFDNDGDGPKDCADSDCDLKIGARRAAVGLPDAYCQYGDEFGAPGSFYGTDPCGDLFDNDADGRQDCYDNQKRRAAGGWDVFLTPAAALGQGNICWRQAAYGCPDKESCTTVKDDDVDTSYGNNDYDDQPLTGINCSDYDCAGDPNCPAQENLDKDGNPADCQCFDGIDNDLDRLIDCSDPDCVGAECDTVPGTCYDKEFDLGQRFNLCADALDNDGDNAADGTDCTDAECTRRFGFCGPCPNYEPYVYSACADGQDNDRQNGADCADSACLGKVGSLTTAGTCAASESSDLQCGDSFDNDRDSRTDCADPDCAGRRQGSDPGAPTCEPGREISCGDGFDNDADGLIDCADSDCWGAGCAAQSWDPPVPNDCQDVPLWSSWADFTETDATVSARHYSRVHVSQADQLDFVGRVAYSSITMIVGDNTNPAKYYPYADVACRLYSTVSVEAGAPVEDGRFQLTVVPGHGLMIANRPLGPGGTIANFRVSLVCPTPAAPATRRAYTVSVSMLKSDGNPEYGEISASTWLLEATPPFVNVVEAEGAEAGVITVSYGEKRRFRVIPRDDGTYPADASGICRCELLVDGEPASPAPPYRSADTACLIDPSLTFTRDRGVANPLQLTAWSRDGAGNRSAPLTADVQIDVTPVLETPLSLSEPADFLGDAAITPFPPFFNSRFNQVRLSAEFKTADLGSFVAEPCQVYLYDAAGQPFLGPGPIGSVMNVSVSPDAAACYGDITWPVSQMPDGTYYAVIKAADTDGGYAVSNRQILYVCQRVPTGNDDPSNVCHWADFDYDGVAEGFFTTLFTADSKACDNCVNLHNPDQGDPDMNGVGEECESRGRCATDRTYVCSYNSPTYVCPQEDIDHGEEWCQPTKNCCPQTEPERSQCLADPAITCCPEPSVATADVGDPPVPTPIAEIQACRTLWGLCTYGGEVCFSSADCPGPAGYCAGDDKVSCKEDGVCRKLTGDEGTCKGRCVIKTTANCVSDADCPSGDNCRKACSKNADILCSDNEDCNLYAFTGPCIGGDRCEQLMYPWIQAPEGNIFSKKKIRAPEPPPTGQVNATYCIVAKSQVSNFRSELCGATISAGTRYERPKPKNLYSTVLGRVDLKGLLAGKYGEVVEYRSANEFVDQFPGFKNQSLDGRVYLFRGDLEIPADLCGGTDNSCVILDSPNPNKKGSGTVVIIGNLVIRKDFRYEPTSAADLRSLDQLASLGWIVLDETYPDFQGTAFRGNLFIGKDVTQLVGNFLVGGPTGVHTVAPPDSESLEPLTVYGLMVARQFYFSRYYKSSERGSESVIYDGRALANPPPGFEDITKTLPEYGEFQLPAEGGPTAP